MLLKILGLCVRGKRVCAVLEEHLCGHTQAGLRAARVARRHWAGLALSAPVFHRDWLVGIAIFFASESKLSAPFLLSSCMGKSVVCGYSEK